MSSDIYQSSKTLDALSSGYETTNRKGETVEKETIFSYTFDFLKDAGTWAEAIGKLIGLVS